MTKTRARIHGLAALTLALWCPLEAQGQQADAETERLFNEGVNHLAEGRFAEARTSLTSARARFETSAIVLNLALADRGLGRYIEAADSLEHYLATEHRIDAARRAELEGILGEVRAAIAHVTVHVAAVGAQVTVDGRRLESSRFDSAMPINPGHHVFMATGEGLRSTQREEEIHRAQSLRVTLTPQPMFVTGTLRVEPSVADANIYVDHHRVGTGIFEAEMRPGTHRVSVRAQGFPPYRTEVILRAGQTSDLRVTLTHETSIVNRWWFWTGIGAVAAGVTAGLILGLSHTEAPDGGSLGWVVQAQTSP